MKIRIIYTLLLVSFIFIACSDDSESLNSGNATVSMEQPELSFKENRGIVNIPIVVEGQQNGPIRVTVEVSETGSSPAMDDVHYLITSKTIIIPADNTIGNIEMVTVDDDEINEDRTFTITISKAEGATIGSNNSTIITLRDNDAEFYEKLQGKWTFTGIDAWDDFEESFEVTISGYDEDEAGYNQILYVTGILGYSWTSMELRYDYDKENNKISLSIPMGTLFASNVGFNGFANPQNIYLGVAVGGVLNYDGEIPGEIDEDFKEITFDENQVVYGALFDNNPSTGARNGLWFGYYGMKLTK